MEYFSGGNLFTRMGPRGMAVRRAAYYFKYFLFLFCFVLFCFVLFCFVLFCFVLFCFVSFFCDLI